MRKSLVACMLAIAFALLPSPGGVAHAAGTWTWPLTGPVIHGFEPPTSPFGAGHRGIDIAAPVGTPVRSAEAGTVTFAGKVAGHLFVTVDHGGGLVSTYSWVSEVLVAKNDVVANGETIALSGTGHPGVLPEHLHFGVKLNGAYVDPLVYLAPGSVVDLIRLAPISGG
jgi:murein DD-endopeptidase MepM/ murein hydrolase activator NlpD